MLRLLFRDRHWRLYTDSIAAAGEYRVVNYIVEVAENNRPSETLASRSSLDGRCND